MVNTTKNRAAYLLIALLTWPLQNSIAQSDLDESRLTSVARVIEALEQFAETSGSFKVSGAGASDGGQGRFHRVGGTYNNSIAETLAGLGLLSAPLPADPLLARLGSLSNYDFRVHRCKDRVAVFSKADELQPTAEDLDWWYANNCPNAAMTKHDQSYFLLSTPLPELSIDYDQIRINEVARVVAALEQYAGTFGSFKVSGAGSMDGGQGRFHRVGGPYRNSIAQTLAGLELISVPLPADPLHARLGSLSTYDFRVHRCLDRVAVFSKADDLQAATDDLEWWNNNNCTDAAITKHDQTYFQVSKSLSELQTPQHQLGELYTLVFNDEFNGTVLDPTKWDTSFLWGPYYPINNEEQMYVDTLGMHTAENYSPFELTGSTLKITATAVSDSLPVPPRPDFYEADGTTINPIWRPNSYSSYLYNGPSTDSNGNTSPGFEPENVNYLSGIITSYGSLKLTHGYVEMRAKLPAGKGLWPAFWLLTSHYVEDVPEIDVMEFLGDDKKVLYNTYHYFDYKDNWRKVSTPSFRVNGDDWTQQFHTFGMAWSPTEIIWYVDGEETHRITDEEYIIPNQAMYLLANLAVGGSWPGTPDSNTVFPATFEIDYIRAYKRTLDEQLNLADDYQLQFHDEFDGPTLDPTKWNTHFLWGPYLTINREEQYYVDALGSDNPSSTNTPFVLQNGMLSITARPGDHPNSFPIPQEAPEENADIWSQFRTFNKGVNYEPRNYTSGMITSYDAFKFAYGYIEARMRIPKGNGLWPAFWLLNGYYVAASPEIDIMEARGNSPDKVLHSYHLYNGVLKSVSSATTEHVDPDTGYAGDFHTYGVRWRPGRLDWYVDGVIVHTYEDSDYDPAIHPYSSVQEADVGYQNMYVIANLAVGGNFFVSPSDEYVSPVDDNALPASLDIDYIRVYQERHKE